jgi:multidrug transporter EmrE-like cation transporter
MSANLNKALLALGLTGFTYSMIVVGQILWKLGVAKYPVNSLSDAIKFGLTTYFIGGSVMYIFATVVWIYVLSRFQFSYVYPMTCIGYVLALFLGKYLFNEPMLTNRIVGIAVIIIGVIIVSSK